MSSLFGQFLENGPLGIDTKGKTFWRNETLLRLADVIYLDQPAGGGFSILENTHGFAASLDNITDSIEEFLRQFLLLFEEYKNRDFYVAGESYGGKKVGTVCYIGNRCQTVR